MITKFKKKDIPKIIPESLMFQEISLAADKVRAIYTLFGWTHMLKNYEETYNLIEQLLNGSIRDLVICDYKKSTSHSSAGIRVESYIDEEDFFTVDVFFDII